MLDVNGSGLGVGTGGRWRIPPDSPRTKQGNERAVGTPEKKMRESIQWSSESLMFPKSYPSVMITFLLLRLHSPRL